jgi:hypothetical protein
MHQPDLRRRLVERTPVRSSARAQSGRSCAVMPTRYRVDECPEECPEDDQALMAWRDSASGSSMAAVPARVSSPGDPIAAAVGCTWWLETFWVAVWTRQNGAQVSASASPLGPRSA